MNRYSRVFLIFLLLFSQFGVLPVRAAIEGDYEYRIVQGKAQIDKYTGAVGADVVIPDELGGVPVARIAASAFINKQLTSVVIPDSVEFIGSQAFKDNQLTAIVLPSSLTALGNSAFNNNPLASVAIPNGVTVIEAAAFFNNSLESVTLPDSLTAIGNSAFTNNKLESIVLPATVTAIGKTVFKGNLLEEVVIPAQVTEIQESAFESNKLESVEFLGDVQTIGKLAFARNELKNITLPATVTAIGEQAFAGNQLKEIVFPAGLAVLENAAFSNNKLESIVLPPLLTAIAQYTFTSNLIETVTIPAHISEVGEKAFGDNPLKQVKFEGAVASIGLNAFQRKDENHVGSKWYEDQDSAKEWTDKSQVTKAMTVYRSYIVTVILRDGAAELKRFDLFNNEKIPALAVPVKAGYTFAGWYMDAQLNIPWDFDEVVTNDSTLYAKWTENSPPAVVTHTVVFNDGNTELSKQTVTSGDAVAKPADPVKSGYTFRGWYSDAALTTEWDFASKVTGNLTLYAKWTENAPPAVVTHTVVFNDGNTELSKQMVTSGDTVAKPADPVKSGYTFRGWYSDAALTTEWDFASKVTGNLTLYAKWTKNTPPPVVTHTVTFNDGNTEIGNQAVISGDAVVKPVNPVKTGYTFRGWYTDAALTTEWDFASKVTGNLTLYAKWTKNTPPPVVTHTVVFNDGNTEIGNQTVTSGDAVAKPADPVKSGYTFRGWYSDAALTTEWDFASKVTGNLTLYAKWTENVSPPVLTHTVVFNDGNTEIGNQTVISGDPVVKPVNPVKTGYTFTGWYSDAALTTEWDFASKVTGNLTLYAKWTKNVSPPVVTHTVVFTDGSAEVNRETVTSGDAVVKPVNPVKSGYTFTGWYSDAALTTEWDFASKVTGNLTLYAKWTENAPPPVVTHTVVFNDGNTEIGNQTVISGDAVAKPVNPSKTGYTFTGWYTDAALTTEWDFTLKVAGNLTLYAGWTKNPPPPSFESGGETSYNRYTISFDGGNNTIIASQTVEHYSKAAEPAAPVKEGYTFIGWYTELEFTNEWDFTRDIVKENLTLYAKWQKNSEPAEDTEPENGQPNNPTEPDEPNENICSLDFTDTAAHWAREEINEIACRGIITGYLDGSYKPNQPISRQHAALMLARAFELPEQRTAIAFGDVPKTHRYYDAITKVYEAKIFDGTPEGNFNPNDAMTRAQMAKVLVLAFDLQPNNEESGRFRDVPASHWAKDYISTLAQNGVAFGDDGNFKPHAPVTRAQFAAFLYRIMER